MISATESAQAFLEAVGDDPLHAWEHIDPDRVLGQAARLDALAPAARAALPLFGLAVGIKDNFDTAELPTTYGSPIYAGHRPAADAAAVAALRAAGAIIAGKTKLAEFAWMTAPDTRNPIAPGRTPGGSSSGSAAAVAAGHLRVATGTQTAGSINRPASYCEVVGFKPSFGLFPRDGVKLLSPALDTVGLLARSLEDLLPVARALGVRSGRGAAGSDSPRIAFAPTPAYARIAPDARAAIDALVARLGLDEITLPPGYTELVQAQTTIQSYDSARSLAPELASHPAELSDEVRAALEYGAALPAEHKLAATRAASEHSPPLVALLRGYDGVLTPSADGPPPLGLAFTGDPLVCRCWTLIGAPCVSLPLARTAAGLPAGLQLVGAPGDDMRLLTAASALVRRAA